MITVSVAYDGGIDITLDKRIRRAAGVGVEMGSGQMLVPPYRRDLAFQFRKLWMAEEFIESLPKEVRVLT